jgi:hypothetical protein
MAVVIYLLHILDLVLTTGKQEFEKEIDFCAFKYKLFPDANALISVYGSII